MKTRLFSLMTTGFLAFAEVGGAEEGKATPGTVTAGTVTAVVEGREIRAVSGEAVSINTSGATATVNLGQHVLKIGKSTLQMDDQMPSEIPAATKTVDIRVVEDMLTVRADGKEVLRAKLEGK